MPMCYGRWIHHNRITSIQYQKGSYILPKKSVSQQPVALSHVTVLLLTEKLFFVLVIADLDDVMFCKVCVM